MRPVERQDVAEVLLTRHMDTPTVLEIIDFVLMLIERYEAGELRIGELIRIVQDE